jgi:hypothetical protein
VLRAKAALSNKELDKVEELAKKLEDETDELGRQYSSSRGAACYE